MARPLSRLAWADLKREMSIILEKKQTQASPDDHDLSELELDPPGFCAVKTALSLVEDWQRLKAGGVHGRAFSQRYVRVDDIAPAFTRPRPAFFSSLLAAPSVCYFRRGETIWST